MTTAPIIVVFLEFIEEYILCLSKDLALFLYFLPLYFGFFSYLCGVKTTKTDIYAPWDNRTIGR